jgi:hypothetical protein
LRKVVKQIESLSNRLLNPLGFAIVRLDMPPPPPLYPGPFETWSRIKRDEPAAFIGDLSRCVTYNGFSFARNGWHPFVHAASEYLEGRASTYHGSALEGYYSAWQPSEGRAALIGAPDGPDELTRYPAYIIHAPWLKLSPEDRLDSISQIIAEENALLGEPGLTIKDGYGLQGPVSSRKGELEYLRLLGIVRSLQTNGYDRKFGDITAQILVRGEEFRFRIVHGHHRAAALAALGYSSITLVPTMLVDIDNVENWTQVHSGYWSQSQAIQYFHHHFDFDPRAWASERGLT